MRYILLLIFFCTNLMADEINLATTGNGAVIYSSEYRRGFDSGKLFDNQARTWYESLDGKQDRTITVEWRKLVEFSQVKISFKEPYTGKIQLAYYHHDAFYDIPGGQIDAQNSTEVNSRFMVQRSEKIRLTFSSDKILKIAGITVTGLPGLAYQSSWSAKWIWGAKSNRKITFRKIVQIDNPAALNGAFWQAAADDIAYLKINGKDLGSATFYRLGLFNIKPYLAPGANTFEATAIDSGGAYGFLSEILLDYGQEAELIPSDNSWQIISGTATSPAQIVHNSPPDCPWGDIEHVNFLSQKAEVIIEKIEIPITIKPNQILQGKLLVKATAPVTEPICFYLQLGNIAPGKSDLRVAQCDVPVELSPDKICEVPFAMEIGPFAPNGEVMLNLQVSGKRTAKIRYQDRLSDLRGNLQLTKVKIDRFPTVAAARTVYPRIEIKRYGDATGLYVDGKIVPQVILTNFNLGYRTMHEYAKTGVQIYRISALGNVVTTPDKQDALLQSMYQILEAEADKILCYNPQALFILNTMMRTTPEWVQAHPDEMTLHGDGTRATSHHSIASTQWRQDSTNVIDKLIKYVNSRPWGKNVIGYAFADGGGGEFHQYGKKMGLVERDMGFTGDFSPAAIKSFREWLKNKYKNNTSIQTAWSNPFVTLDNAAVDNKTLMTMAENGFFYNPATQRVLIDYWDWLSYANSQNLLVLCQAAKRSSPHRILTGGFLGYWFHIATQYPAGGQETAHAGFIDLINSPEIDFISLPYNYFNRQPGSSFFLGMFHNSLLLRNKLSINEFDTRTHIANLDAAVYGQQSLHDAEEIFKRDIGASLCSGIGWWWLDFSMGNKGQNSIPWYDDPALNKLISKGYNLSRESLQKPFVNRSEIAVMVDMKSALRVDIFGSIPNYNTVYNTIINAVPAIGAPSDIYDLQDIESEYVQKKYKMYFFPNAYLLTSDQRKIITEKLQRDGKTLVWLWAPGYVTPEELSLQTMKDVTGINFIKADNTWKEPVIKLKPTLLTNNAPDQLKLADWHISFFRNRPFYEKRIAPTFTIDDPNAVVCGTFANSNQPALVYKKMQNYTSIYCALPNINANILRNAAKLANVHIYWDGPIASLHAGGNFISLHNGLTPNHGTLNLLGDEKLTDAFSGQVVVDRELKLSPGESRLFKIGN